MVEFRKLTKAPDYQFSLRRQILCRHYVAEFVDSDQLCNLCNIDSKLFYVWFYEPYKWSDLFLRGSSKSVKCAFEQVQNRENNVGQKVEKEGQQIYITRRNPTL